MNEEQVRKVVQEEMAKIFHSEKYHFSRDIQIANGRNIELGTSVGTMIGTETTQKLAFLGATPIARQTGVLRNVSIDPTSDPAGWDVYARAGVQSINTALTNLGLATY